MTIVRRNQVTVERKIDGRIKLSIVDQRNETYFWATFCDAQAFYNDQAFKAALDSLIEQMTDNAKHNAMIAWAEMKSKIGARGDVG